MALKHAEKNSANVLIVSDSQSALMALNSLNPHHKALIYEARYKLEKIQGRGGSVLLLWIPSHINIIMHDRADEYARMACHKPEVECSFGLPLKVIKTVMTQDSFHELHNLRSYLRNESSTVKHYDAVCRYVIPYGQYTDKSRLCDVVTARIRLGYRYMWQMHPDTVRTPDTINCKVCNMPYGHHLEHYVLACRYIEKFRPKDLNFIELCQYFTESGTLQDILNEYPMFANP